jgi:hypothetical protein
MNEAWSMPWLGELAQPDRVEGIGGRSWSCGPFAGFGADKDIIGGVGQPSEATRRAG